MTLLDIVNKEKEEKAIKQFQDTFPYIAGQINIKRNGNKLKVSDNRHFLILDIDKIK